MRRRALILLAGTAVLAGWLPSTAAQHNDLPVISLSAGLYVIRAEVARTPATLQRGLMFRRELAEQNGMLFMFGQTARQCMWMKNTLLPLSVAFLRDDGTIVNVEDMAPQTETSHCSNEPVRLALEMNAGWFAKRNVSPGTVIRGLPALPSSP